MFLLVLSIHLNCGRGKYKIRPMWGNSASAKIRHCSKVTVKDYMELRWDMACPWIKDECNIWGLWGWSANTDAHSSARLLFWNCSILWLKTMIQNITWTAKTMKIWHDNLGWCQTSKHFVWCSIISSLNCSSNLHSTWVQRAVELQKCTLGAFVWHDEAMFQHPASTLWSFVLQYHFIDDDSQHHRKL